MAYGLFQDSEGNVSSKRVAGFICLAASLLSAVLMAPLDIYKTFLWAAVAFLAGGTAAEQIGSWGK